MQCGAEKGCLHPSVFDMVISSLCAQEHGKYILCGKYSANRRVKPSFLCEKNKTISVLIPMSGFRCSASRPIVMSNGKSSESLLYSVRYLSEFYQSSQCRALLLNIWQDEACGRFCVSLTSAKDYHHVRSVREACHFW